MLPSDIELIIYRYLHNLSIREINQDIKNVTTGRRWFWYGQKFRNRTPARKAWKCRHTYLFHFGCSTFMNGYYCSRCYTVLKKINGAKYKCTGCRKGSMQLINYLTKSEKRELKREKQMKTVNMYQLRANITIGFIFGIFLPWTQSFACDPMEYYICDVILGSALLTVINLYFEDVKRLLRRFGYIDWSIGKNWNYRRTR